MLPVRNKYTKNDQTVMWRFVMRLLHEGRGECIKGNIVWEEFAKHHNATGSSARSVSSLTSHFRKKMLPTLAEADIALEDIVYIHNKIPLASFDIDKFRTRCSVACRPELVEKLKQRGHSVPRHTQDIFDTSPPVVVAPIDVTIEDEENQNIQPEEEQEAMNETVTKVIENFRIRKCKKANPQLGLPKRQYTKRSSASAATPTVPRRSQRLAKESPAPPSARSANSTVIISPAAVKKKNGNRQRNSSHDSSEQEMFPGSPVTRLSTLRKRKAVRIIQSSTDSDNDDDDDDFEIVLDSHPSEKANTSAKKVVVNNDSSKKKTLINADDVNAVDDAVHVNDDIAVETVPVTEEVHMNSKTVPTNSKTVPTNSKTVPLSSETVSDLRETITISSETIPIISETVPVNSETVLVSSNTVLNTNNSEPIDNNAVIISEEIVRVNDGDMSREAQDINKPKMTTREVQTDELTTSSISKLPAFSNKTPLPVSLNKSSLLSSLNKSAQSRQASTPNVQNVVGRILDVCSSQRREKSSTVLGSLRPNVEYKFFLCQRNIQFVSDLLRDVDRRLQNFLSLEELLHREFRVQLALSSSSADFEKRLLCFGDKFKRLIDYDAELITITQEDIITANLNKFSKPLLIPESKIPYQKRVTFLNGLFRSLHRFPLAKVLKIRCNLLNAEGNAVKIGSMKKGLYDHFTSLIRYKFLLIC